jgi:hypothetical protein
MFQAGRTATTVANADHLTNQFGKALLRHHLTKEGRTDLLEHLPKLEITMADAVMDAVGQHLARLAMPKVVQIRYAVKTGKYRLGNGQVRDPVRVQVVEAKLDRLDKLREEATKRAEGQKSE